MKNSSEAPRQALPPGKPAVVTVQNGVNITEHRFNHVSVTELGGPGVILANQEGQVIAFFPYDNVISIVLPESDREPNLITPVQLLH